jgi:hypothetical protein
LLSQIIKPVAQSGGFLAVRRQRQYVRDIAFKVYPKGVVFWCQQDAVDQAT